MVNDWYTLIMGILLSLNGIIFLIFTPDQFKQPNWYIGLILIVGVLGIILGIVGVAKSKKSEVKEEKSGTADRGSSLN